MQYNIHAGVRILSLSNNPLPETSKSKANPKATGKERHDTRPRTMRSKASPVSESLQMAPMVASEVEGGDSTATSCGGCCGCGP